MDKKVSIDNIYSLIRKDDELSNVLIDCLFIQNWFNSIFDFDPITNKPLSSTNDYLFSRINNIETAVSKFWWNDRVENIIRFTENSVFSLFDMLHNKIMSEHIITHSNKIKETDSTSIRWLSKKPGRTVRQKIADSGKMMGVFHIASIDTTENRLLKAFLMRMDNILYEKEQLAHHLNFSIPDNTSNFIIQVHRWLKSEDASYIGSWNNSYPNNTLLNDKNYRKIWNAWCSLQQINELLNEDISKIERLKCIYYFWNRIAELSIHPNYRLLQAPVFRNENSLNIDSYFTNIAGWYIQNGQRESVFFELKHEFKCISIIKNGYTSLEKIPEISYSHKKKETNLKVYDADCCAFDLTTIKPYFATSNKRNGTLDSKLIYQTWQSKESGNKKIDVDCSNSKMISIKHALNTITIHDYFNDDFLADGINPSSAASIFAESVKKQLKSNSYIYLLPDELDDFSKMQIALRHQLNVKFSNITPLPRSIARVFQSYEKEGVEILSKKFIVVDKFDDYWIVTKVIPKKSDLLLKKYPESDGIIFEHYPSTVIYKEELEKNKLFTLKDIKQLHNDFTLDEDHIVQSNITLNLSEMDKKLEEFRKNQSEEFEYISVTPNDNLSLGAISYFNFQKETPDVILWREHLPPLRLETSGQKLILVDETTEGISPKKGEEKEIPVMTKFEMPAGKDFYEFSLYKGERKEKSKYYAYLTNESFPLSKNIVCKLKLTFTYGDEQPYKLKFIPDDKNNKASFNYILAKWETESHQDHRKLPFPDFCKEYTWEDMRHYAGRKSSERGDASNFIEEWLPSEFEKIKQLPSYERIEINRILSSTRNERGKFENEVEFSLNGKMLTRIIPSKKKLLPDDILLISQTEEESIVAEYPKLIESSSSKFAIEHIHSNSTYSLEKKCYETVLFLLGNEKTGSENVYCVISTNKPLCGNEIIRCIPEPSQRGGYRAKSPVLESLVYRIESIAKSWQEMGDRGLCYISNVYLNVNKHSIFCRLKSNREPKIGDKVSVNSFKKQQRTVINKVCLEKEYFGLTFPMLTVWNSGRSIQDGYVDNDFMNKFYEARKNVLDIFKANYSSLINKEMLFFLCAIHKDTLPEVSEQLIPLLLNNSKIESSRYLSFAIGDCSLDWQKNLLEKVIENIEIEDLRENSIRTLASAAWRVNSFIYNLDYNSIKILLNGIYEESCFLLSQSKEISEAEGRFDGVYKYNLSFVYSCCYEILLAILRLRNTEDIATLDLLSPFSNKLLVKIIENLSEISRLKILNVKERFTFSGDLKLQQAVEKYTNGDLGENEIRILSIEEDND